MTMKEYMCGVRQVLADGMARMRRLWVGANSTRKIWAILITVLCVAAFPQCMNNSQWKQINGHANTCFALGQHQTSNGTTRTSIFDISSIPPLLTLQGVYPDGTAGEMGIVTWLVLRMQSILQVACADIYQQISGDAGFRTFVGAALTIAVIFFLAAIALGVQQAHPYTTTVFLIKMSVILVLTFRWDVFEAYVVDLVESFVYDMTYIVSSVFSGGQGAPDFSNTAGNRLDQGLFYTIDRMVGMVFSSQIFMVLDALTNMQKDGILYAALFFIMIITSLWAAMEAVKIWVVAMIMRCLLYATSCLFIWAAADPRTKSLSDGWIEQLINFTLQAFAPFIIVGMMMSINAGFFSVMLKDPLQMMCRTACLNQVHVLAPTIYCMQFGSGAAGAPTQQGLAADIPFQIWAMVSVVVINLILLSMLPWIVQVCARTSSGLITATTQPIVSAKPLMQGLGGFVMSGGKVEGFKQAYRKGSQQAVSRTLNSLFGTN